MLLSDRALAKIISGYEWKLAALELKHEKAVRDLKAQAAAASAVCKAKVDGEIAKAAATRSGCLRERVLYEGALKRARHSPWYKSSYLNFLLGSVVAGGICTATSFAVNK